MEVSVAVSRAFEIGGRHMKLMCKCGNIEVLKTDVKPVNYEIRNCGDGTLALVCKKCDHVVFIGFKDK